MQQENADLMLKFFLKKVFIFTFFHQFNASLLNKHVNLLLTSDLV